MTVCSRAIPQCIKRSIAYRLGANTRAVRAKTTMTTFTDPTFSYESYAASRPSYPPALYEAILQYHRGKRDQCLDLGTGHGLVARALAPSFAKMIATDPSEGMLKQAESLTSKEDYPQISYETGSSDDVAASVSGGSVDMVVAAQAAHWFDYEPTWKELARVMRPGSTLAFWGYADIVLPENKAATDIIHRWMNSSGLLGSYWSQPGRSIVENLLRDVVPSSEFFVDVERVEYVPGTNGRRSGEGRLFMEDSKPVKEIMSYVRTWSAFHKWQQANPEGSRERKGDAVDWMFEEVAERDPAFADPSSKIAVEWGTGVLLARRR